MVPAPSPAFRLRPLGLGDILDEAFRIYRANFGLMFGAALIASLPVFLTDVASGQGGLFGDFMRLTQPSQAAGTLADSPLLPMYVAGVLLALVMAPVTTTITTYAACSAALGLPSTVATVFRHTLRTYWRVWGVFLLVFLVALSSVLCLTIPFVVFFLVRFGLCYQAVYLENAGVTGSLGRSSILVRGSWWRVLGTLVVTWILVFLVALVLGSIADLLGLALPGGIPRRVVTGVLTAMVQALTLPFSSLAVTLLYLDLRIRKENLDLQLMAGQAGQPAYSDAPPPGAGPAWSDLPPVNPG